MNEGCPQWLQNGLAPPKTVTDATDAYMEGKGVLSRGLMIIANSKCVVAIRSLAGL
jgi:hypothetical protein